jgi:sterol desaturase/sphingolipid hydroxylase (fatty acid hydroxylase superfamily)
MQAWLLQHSSALYQIAMAAGFLLIAAWETLRPRREPVLSTARRWLVHGGFLVLGRGLMWLALPVGAIGLSVEVARSPYGLLNRTLLPFSLRCVLAFLLLDLALWVQHYLLHHVPLLWRLHQVHHSDADYDLSTGFRFHPIESLYLQGVVLLVIALTAPPVSAVIWFELVNVVQTYFGHANVRLPGKLDRLLRLVQVTPELHRVHHSIEVSDQNTNFGAVFTFWDRMFGTLRAEARDGDAIRFGLREVAAPRSTALWDMLKLPFQSKSSATAVSATPGREAAAASD